MKAEAVINGEALLVSTLTDRQVAHCLTHVRDWNRRVDLGGQGERYDIEAFSQEGFENLAACWYAANNSVLDTGRMASQTLFLL